MATTESSVQRAPDHDQAHVHACLCYDGYHYMGEVVLTPDGDEEVEYIRLACRRCAQKETER
jgi:hypothetical protein